MDVAVGKSLALRSLVTLDANAIAEAGDPETAISELVKKQGWKGRKVVILDATGRSEHHIIETPPGSSAEITLLVERQLAGILSSPLESFLRRTLPLGHMDIDGRRKALTLAVLTPTTEIENLTAIIGRTGLEIMAVTTYLIALLGAARHSPSSGTEAWIHLDAGIGTLAFMRQGRLLSYSEIRYGEGASVGNDPASIAGEIQRSVDLFRQNNADYPLALARVSGWDASEQVFDMLASGVMPTETIAAPPVDLSQLAPGTEGVDGYLYANALLLWCGVDEPPLNLVPRSLLRPARVRKLVVTGAVVAAAYTLALAVGMTAVTQRKVQVEREREAISAEKAKIPVDDKLEAAHAEGQTRLALMGAIDVPVPPVGGFLSGLSFAVGDGTVLSSIAIARKGDLYEAKVEGLAYGNDAAAAQAEFDRFVAELRGKPSTRDVLVGELKLEQEGAQLALPASSVALRFEIKVVLGGRVS